MLQTVRELLPFFAAFFLLESLTYLRSGHLLFVSQGLSFFARKGGGLRLGALLPGGRELTAWSGALPITSDGVYLPRRPDGEGVVRFDPASFAFRSFGELPPTEVEHHYLHIGRESLALPSAAHARTLHRRVEELRSLAPEGRPRRIEELMSESLDRQALEARRSEVEAATALLRPLCWSLALLLFVALPVAAFGVQLSPARLKVLLVGVAVNHLAVLAVGGWVARRLDRDPARPARGAWLTALLLPPAAVRLAPSLLRNTLHGFDQVALAAALLPCERFATVAATELHGARHAAEAGDEGWRRWWRRRAEAIELLVAGAGLTVETLAPGSQDPGAAAYCPLCAGEYRSGVERCEGCAVDLVPFRTESSAA